MAAVAPPDGEELRNGMGPPREPLASHLDSYTAEVPRKLPASLQARAAPHLLMQIYGAYPMRTEFIMGLVRRKQLEGHHIGHEMQVLALAADSQAKSDSNATNAEACETLCRRVYGIRRASRAATSLTDWQQPQGQGVLKRESRVQWGLLDEADLRALKADSCTIDAVEEDLRKQFERKALMNERLEKGVSSPEGHAPE